MKTQGKEAVAFFTAVDGFGEGDYWITSSYCLKELLHFECTTDKEDMRRPAMNGIVSPCDGSCRKKVDLRKVLRRKQKKGTGLSETYQDERDQTGPRMVRHIRKVGSWPYKADTYCDGNHHVVVTYNESEESHKARERDLEESPCNCKPSDPTAPSP